MTEAQVWEALAEVPDPEIPVVSVVDLGVVRGVRVEDGRAHVEFTPTFLGCPALEVMREQMAARVAELGVEAEVEVVLDDSWSTDRITGEGRREAPRGGVLATRAERGRRTDPRAARVERVPLPLLRLARHVAREHLRPDAVPLAALLPQLPPAVRAVQDDLRGGRPAVRPGGLLETQRNPPCQERTWSCAIRRSDCAVIALAAAVAKGTSCWQTVPAGGSASVSMYALTASSMQGEFPP